MPRLLWEVAGSGPQAPVDQRPLGALEHAQDCADGGVQGEGTAPAGPAVVLWGPGGSMGRVASSRLNGGVAGRT